MKWLAFALVLLVVAGLVGCSSEGSDDEDGSSGCGEGCGEACEECSCYDEEDEDKGDNKDNAGN